MSNPIPSDWIYSNETIDKHFCLSLISGDRGWQSNVCQRINLLSFMGKDFSYWSLDGGLAESYCENFLILLASLIESILSKTFEEKENYCQTNCPFGRPSDCDFYWGKESFVKDGETIRKRNSESSFKGLIDVAENFGLLTSFSAEDLNLLRAIRNRVHISSRGSKTEICLNPSTVNGYILSLRKVCIAAMEWLGKQRQNCPRLKLGSYDGNQK
jgi:hypothetical protein